MTPGSGHPISWMHSNVARIMLVHDLRITVSNHSRINSLLISPETSRTLGLVHRRKDMGKVNAAIIREKGVNGDREMAWVLYQAGFNVKDVHMTDLISGREDLSDIQMIVFVGGFSNSDVLGSAKGWAGAFIYNDKANQALKNFYAREDTMSLGVCNGCQLMMELDLLYPEKKNHPKMQHNSSHKFESAFVSVEIPETNTIMMQGLAGSRLGVWLAHGEGRFELPEGKDGYQIAARYAYEAYPGNPNGSDFSTAALVFKGRSSPGNYAAS